MLTVPENPDGHVGTKESYKFDAVMRKVSRMDVRSVPG